MARKTKKVCFASPEDLRQVNPKNLALLEEVMEGCKNDGIFSEIINYSEKIKGKYQWEVEKKDGPCKNDIEKLTL